MSDVMDWPADFDPMPGTLLSESNSLGDLQATLELIGYPDMRVRRRGTSWEAAISKRPMAMWVGGISMAKAVCAAIEAERIDAKDRARRELEILKARQAELERMLK